MKIVFPELGGSNEWIQTSNPATDSTISGFESVQLDYPLNGFGQPWGGLALGTGSNQALIDDTPNSGIWWMCIGCQSWFSSTGYIPGPRSNSVTRVQLYVSSSLAGWLVVGHSLTEDQFLLKYSQ